VVRSGGLSALRYLTAASLTTVPSWPLRWSASCG